MPMPPRPGGVEMAAMVSVSGGGGSGGGAWQGLGSESVMRLPL
jgi:hypothetical protein